METRGPSPVSRPGFQTLWEALRNGLAHNFRPQTIKVAGDEWRYAISSKCAPQVSIEKGSPHWIMINIREFSSRVISQIDAYEKELRTSAEARLKFHEKSKSSYVKTLNSDAAWIADAKGSLG